MRCVALATTANSANPTAQGNTMLNLSEKISATSIESIKVHLTKFRDTLVKNLKSVQAGSIDEYDFRMQTLSAWHELPTDHMFDLIENLVGDY